MKLSHNSRRRRQGGISRAEAGYAYIMALGMVLVMIAGSQVILRNMVTEARSQREAEMIWRGNQYARAIRQYYRKAGHFPQTQDDLLTGVPDYHFLRSEVMKDPMNTQDGAWRFIYTNASGAIIGSVKYGSMQQMALMDMNGGVMPGAQSANGANGTAGANTGNPTTDTTNQNGPPGATNGGSTATAPGTTGTAGGLFGLTQTPGGGSTATTGLPTTSLSGLNQPNMGMVAGPQPTGPVDGPVIGGMIIGVGSTVDRASVRVYKGGKKYNQWEFIWNPIEEQARQVQQGLGQAGATGQTGVPGLGLPLGTGGSSPFTVDGTTVGGGAGNNGAPANPAGSNGANGPNNPNPTDSGNSNNSSNPSQ